MRFKVETGAKFVKLKRLKLFVIYLMRCVVWKRCLVQGNEKRLVSALALPNLQELGEIFLTGLYTYSIICNGMGYIQKQINTISKEFFDMVSS